MRMNNDTIQVAWNAVMQLGECPLWVPEQETLYWVDIIGSKVHRLHPATNLHQYWDMPSEPAAIARAASGGLIVAMRYGFYHLDTQTGALREITPAHYDPAVNRFNDGRCDAAGRFWVGTLYEPRDQPLGQMHCLARGQASCIWQGGMTVSNGLAFSLDQRLMYHADTTSHSIRCYDFDVALGQVSNPRLFKQFSTDKSKNYGGRPDGAAVDSEGAYWCAMYEGGRLLRISPGGEILREIALPVRCPTMLAFGGADLRTIYITSASYLRSVAELEQYPLSGQLLTLRVDVPGMAEYQYIE